MADFEDFDEINREILDFDLVKDLLCGAEGDAELVAAVLACMRYIYVNSECYPRNMCVYIVDPPCGYVYRRSTGWQPIRSEVVSRTMLLRTLDTMQWVALEHPRSRRELTERDRDRFQEFFRKIRADREITSKVENNIAFHTQSHPARAQFKA